MATMGLKSVAMAASHVTQPAPIAGVSAHSWRPVCNRQSSLFACRPAHPAVLPSCLKLSHCSAFGGRLLSGPSPLTPGLLRPGRTGLQKPVRQTTCMAKKDDEIDIADRIISSVVYLLPLFDALRYGRFIFQEFPDAQIILAPVEPLARLYFATPFASLAVFFFLYFLVVMNQKYTRFVRFNTQQAILLDILLIVPGIVESAFKPGGEGLGLQLYISFENTVFLFILVSFFYACFENLRGQLPRLPIVAEAVDNQVPF
eukprot:jgi/Mesvir1/23020/Mv14615-RA.1